MSKKQIIKLLCLNLGIALLNVILFSAGFVGLNFSGDALTTALGVTVIVMSIVTFFYGNCKVKIWQKSCKGPPCWKAHFHSPEESFRAGVP